MFHDLPSLPLEELERLYIKESQKHLSGIAMGFSHNTLQSIKLSLTRIDKEINSRKQMTFKRVA
jgi:hypothetical protein